MDQTLERVSDGCGYFWASRFWCDFSCLRT
jgi:hypothetical protein